MKRALEKLSIATLLILNGCGQESEYNTDNRSHALAADQQPVDENATMEGAVAAGCGNDLFSQALDSDQIVNQGRVPLIGNYTVKADSTITLEREKVGLNVVSNFKLSDVSPAIARSEAEKTLAKLNGKRTVTLLKSNWLDFFAASNNTDLKCSVFPASLLTTETSGGTTIVSFDPPLPFLISPSMAGEITRELTFKEVVATVQQTGDSSIKKGSTYAGTATIRPVSASEFDADSAYEVVIDFGGVEKTTALGILHQATYFIKSQKFKAIVVETGNEGTPQVTYKTE